MGQEAVAEMRPPPATATVFTPLRPENRMIRSLREMPEQQRYAREMVMSTRHVLQAFIPIVIALAGPANSQIQRPGVGPTNPDRQNQDMETRQQIQLINEQARLRELERCDKRSQDPQQGNGKDAACDQAIAQAQVAKFMEAIKHRMHRYSDFDQVVLHSKTPVTPLMLALMADSPFAADIAYYLGKHPEQSAAIALMPPAEAGTAVRQLEATVAAGIAARK
jgi:hypothetical protein